MISGPEHVKVHHGIYVGDIRKRPVQKIPRTGKSLIGRTKGHKKHRTTEQDSICLNHPRELEHRGQSGSIAVGSVIYPLH